jgi:hypothetical protein
LLFHKGANKINKKGEIGRTSSMHGRTNSYEFFIGKPGRNSQKTIDLGGIYHERMNCNGAFV